MTIFKKVVDLVPGDILTDPGPARVTRTYGIEGDGLFSIEVEFDGSGGKDLWFYQETDSVEVLASS